MRSKYLTIIAGLVFVFSLSIQTARAQTVRRIPAKEASLIAHVVREANQPDHHSKNDFYLMVTIGKIEYLAELRSGKIVSRGRTENSGGGFSGAYAEVSLRLMDKAKADTGQGSSQILKLSGGKWKRIALNETDYQCDDVKSIPKSVLKALGVECN